MTARLDLTGKTFGRLKVIKLSHVRNHFTYWLCSCICGKEKVAVGIKLVNGNTKSCGCLKVELTIKRNTTHGSTYSVEYTCWEHLINDMAGEALKCALVGIVLKTFSQIWGKNLVQVLVLIALITTETMNLVIVDGQLLLNKLTTGELKLNIKKAPNKGCRINKECYQSRQLG